MPERAGDAADAIELRGLGKVRNAVRRRIVEPDFRRFSTMLKLIESRAPRVLFWHDSVWIYKAREDNDQPAVVDLVGAELGTLPIGAGGWHTGVFSSLAAALRSVPHRPQVVAFPVTLPRSTSVQWFGRPDLQFDELIDLATVWAERPRPVRWLRRRTYPAPAAWENYADMAAPSEFSDLSTVRQFLAVTESRPEGTEEKQQRRREMFAFQFGHPVDVDHPRIQQLADAAACLEQLGCKPLLWVTPMNLLAGVELLGPSFAEHVRAHISAARAALRRRGVAAELHDFHDRFDPDLFLHHYHSAEHLRAPGHRQVAEWVVALARQALADRS